MMITHVDRYLLLRQTLGFKLLQVTRLLRAFANFVDQRGETHISVTAAVAWATEATTPGTRYVRLQSVVQLARFLRTEDPLHEVPPLALFPATTVRPLPYIYAPEEVERLVRAAGQLHRTYPLRRETYATLFGLIAATGMRVSEALGLRLADVQPNGLLLIREAKLGKSRLVPLHPSTVDALNNFLDKRRKLPATDDHLFLSPGGRRISRSTVNYMFRRVAKLANVASARKRPCRIHDLRHTFATRSLERCSTRREGVARHFVALSTYIGHSDIKHTYWYLESTPELLADIAAAAEALVTGGAP
jgi:integrase/recombinase XerD